MIGKTNSIFTTITGRTQAYRVIGPITPTSGTVITITDIDFTVLGCFMTAYGTSSANYISAPTNRFLSFGSSYGGLLGSNTAQRANTIFNTGGTVHFTLAQSGTTVTVTSSYNNVFVLASGVAIAIVLYGEYAEPQYGGVIDNWAINIADSASPGTTVEKTCPSGTPRGARVTFTEQPHRYFSASSDNAISTYPTQGTIINFSTGTDINFTLTSSGASWRMYWDDTAKSLKTTYYNSLAGGYARCNLNLEWYF